MSERRQSDAGSNQQTEPETKATLWQVIVSVLAAAFGVQSKSHLERDFKQTSPWPYILVGVVFTAVFVVTLIVIVEIVLKQLT